MDYNILNINRNASNEDIRKAYYKLGRIYHPDKNPGDKQSEQQFKEINEAYENIINGKSRDERTFFYSFTNISFPPELVKFAEKILQSDGGKTIYDKVCKISSIIQTGIPSEIHNYKNFYDNFNDKLIKIRNNIIQIIQIIQIIKIKIFNLKRMILILM